MSLQDEREIAAVAKHLRDGPPVTTGDQEDLGRRLQLAINSITRERLRWEKLGREIKAVESWSRSERHERKDDDK